MASRLLYIPMRPSFEDRIRVGQYAWVSPDIISDNFPIAVPVGYTVRFELFDFGPDVESEWAIATMARRGFEPSDLAELLVLGKMLRNKGVRKELLHHEGGARVVIPALRSVWKHPKSGALGVPVLNANCVEQELAVDAYCDTWMRCRFFGIKRLARH